MKTPTPPLDSPKLELVGADYGGAAAAAHDNVNTPRDAPVDMRVWTFVARSLYLSAPLPTRPLCLHPDAMLDMGVR